ncbi:Homoserine dehydrogenase [Candidatus Magnetaquicoccaceae bacterium FCR-1]|uniref:Homoserine dehydrogenase n=1 Tax=Candidatus Magnetaquiglobus chichijimensis TaxID=3141448 RepID=A0ABQ0C7C9_9PROT
MEALRIGMLGFGTVGRGVADLLLNHQELLAQRAGVPLRLVRIATRTPERDRGLPLGNVELTGNVNRVLDAQDLDVVVELIGGIIPARDLVGRALESGKHVITANKALIAEFGHEIFALANSRGVQLGFEAAVAGAVPVIKALRESLSGNRIDLVYGILNGTCNYILTEMREKGLPFAEVLAAAQAKGYAEADPSFDVDGIDAAHKLAILTAIAFGARLDFSHIDKEGIRHVSEVDIAWAREMGYRLKLLGMARMQEGMLEVAVRPVMVPEGSMVAAVEGVSNAVFVHGDFAGTTMYHGRGAGERPTASAVVADLMDLARDLKAGAKNRVPPLSVPVHHLRTMPIQTSTQRRGSFYIRLAVADQPGVLADITAILAKQAISIDAIHQKGRSPVEAVPLVMVTHETTESRLFMAMEEIELLDAVREPPRAIRIESALA